MSSKTLLTDLCAICHVNTIKYTCPRCGIHTCSLPCVKKHKAWAQCSGVRNPAEYRKRSELATPSSIDKDFNFITNIERSVARADDDVLGRGINLAPPRALRPVDARPKFEVEIEKRGVKVVKAPRGLSRARQNKTHWVNQQQSIMWTIEWICSDGEKIIGSALETRTLGEAYINTVGKKKIKRKRWLTQHDQEHLRSPPKVNKQKGDGGPSGKPPTTEDESQNGHSDAISPDEKLLTGLYFYLHNPCTSSKLKCVIALSPNQTITAALQGHTVIEFPTIYAKNESSAQLKEPFISQDEYQKHHGADTPLNVTLPLEEGEIEESGQTNLAAKVDALRVMEVLAQDLEG